MGSVHSRSVLSSSMNMVITIFGFVLSAVFMFIICCRLLCFRLRRGNNLEIAHAARRSSPVNQAWQGLDPSIVKVFPTIKFNQQIFVSSEDNSCTICLGDYKEKEALRFLPRCGHAFHVACIDMWLGQHSTCPICRISLRTFPEWRHFSCPLISLSAKPRFVPGALPDTMFERPSGFHIAPKSAFSGLSKDSLVHGASNKTVIPGSGISAGYLNASTSMSVENNVVSEAAESSISRWQRRGETQIVEESSRDSEGPSIPSHCVLSERLMHLALPRTHSNGDNSVGECRTPNIGELHIRLPP